MNQDNTEPSQANTSLLNWAAAKRDGLLVIGSGVYILGYLVWSFNAFQNNLGLLPAIESQYFLAGVIPAIIIGGVYLFLKTENDISEFLYRYLKPGGKGMRRVARWVINILFIAVFIMYFGTINWSHAFKSWFSPIWNERPITIVSAGFLFPCMYLFFHTTSMKEAFKDLEFDSLKSVLQLQPKIYGYISSIAFASFALGIYLFWIYPILPQEFGGVKPRCAYIDIVKDQVSSATLAKLTNSTGTPTSDTIRSEQLSVFFAGKDVLLVKVSGNTSSEVIELARNRISAIIWCQ